MVGVPMKRIGLPVLIAVLFAAIVLMPCPLLGQPVDCPERHGLFLISQAFNAQNSDAASRSLRQVQHIQFADASPAIPAPIPSVPMETLPVFRPQNAPQNVPPNVQQNASQNSPQNSPPNAPQNIPQSARVPALPVSGVPMNSAPMPNNLPAANVVLMANNVPVANNMPVQVPAVMARPVAQNAVTQNAVAHNAVTQNHRLRLPPQVFERNLIERLGSRSVPVQNVAADAGIAQYRLPARDGTAIELTVNRQQGMVSITGAPAMVDACLKIVRLLDVQEVAGGSVTRFMPVQQSNVNAARQVANIVNQETLRVAQAQVAQATPQPVAGAPVPFGLSEDELTAAGVVGPVEIEIIDAFGTVIIQGSPGDVAIIQGMLRELEALSLENEPVIELIPLQHADSLRVSQLVLQLYQQVHQVRRGPITMLPLVKPNTILIIGRQESINTAKELIEKLDTPVIPNANFRIFHLRYAAVLEVAPQINQSFMGRPGFGQGLAPQLNIAMDVRTNALIVQANPRDMLEIEAMIRQLDVPGSEITSFMRRFPLRNALATEMQLVLTNALNTGAIGRGTMLSTGEMDAAGNLMRSSVAHNVSIVPDARSNSLIVTAPPDTMPLIAALIEQLDQLPAAESRIRVFTLANGDAFALTQLLTNMFAPTAAIGAQTIATVRPGFEEGESTLVSVRFQADTRTNSIVAIGSEGDLAIAEALLLRLDAENMNNRTVFTMRLVNTPADEIAPILNQYFMTERQFNIQNAVSFLPNSPLEQFRMETTVIAEPISNSLIISTTPQQYEMVRGIILELDARPIMVAIDVLIAEVEIRRGRDRGVEFGLQDSILFQTPSPAAFPMFGFANPGTRAVGTQGITSLGVGHAAGANGGFSFSASSESVSLLIRALETNTRTQVLSRPRLVTLHNRRASVLVGEDVPFVASTTITQGIARPETGFRELGTILDITPRIMPDGMIAIALYVERSSLIDMVDLGDSQAPHVRNTNASTTINAMDGQTVIFAGLITEQRRSTNNSIPGLNRIPVLRHLFEFDSRSYDRSELLIVLTPRIIRTEEDMMILNRQERERMQWCVSDVVRLTGDSGMRRRSDEWFHNEVRHTIGTPVQLHESQLPADERIPTPRFPTIETR